MKGEEKMLFKTGVDVYSSDNEKIGTLHRVVMDPKTKEVSHIIVKEGFLFTGGKSPNNRCHKGRGDADKR